MWKYKDLDLNMKISVNNYREKLEEIENVIKH